MQLELNENEKMVLQKILKHIQNKSKKVKDNNEKLKLKFTFDTLKNEIKDIEKSLENGNIDHPDDQESSQNIITDENKIPESESNNETIENEYIKKKRKHQNMKEQPMQHEDITPKGNIHKNDDELNKDNEVSDQEEMKDVSEPDHPDDHDKDNNSDHPDDHNKDHDHLDDHEELILDTESNIDDDERKKEKKKSKKVTVVDQETQDDGDNEDEEKPEKQKKTKICRKCFRLAKGNHKRIFSCHTCGNLDKSQYTITQVCL